MKKPIIFLTLLISSCTSTPTFTVQHAGALKNMMHMGDISAKTNLADLKSTPNLYAIGAFENLKGEIQIFNSESFNTFVQDSALAFDKTFDKKATLLVWAQVEEWTSIEIPKDITTLNELESFVSAAALKNNIDTTKPFPFLIDATAQSFDWHVINWKDGDRVHTHAKHVNSGLKGTQTDTKVELLGFYSTSHHAIFTHHTTNMHIHVKSASPTIAGHLDGLVLGNGGVLRVPEG